MKSLYVHIPFCSHICSYCDFCKVFYKEEWASQYLDALCVEIKEKKIEGHYDTVYIGGGTPSSLNENQLKRLFHILSPFTKNVKEYTIEVNPESLTKEKIDLFIENKINRLSVGIQTFHDELLSLIERYHSAHQAKEMIQLAYEKGIHDINVDLIYGLPKQGKQELLEDLNELIELPISHVSIYSLILEDHTRLKIEGYQPIDDDQDAAYYALINHFLKKHGFKHYETSNYYKIKPSYHNLTYWHYGDYDGIGLGAHSLKKHQRIENTQSLTQYLKHQFIKEITPLTKEDEIFETIMMGLRLVEGFSILDFNERYSVSFLDQYKDVIDKYKKKKMLEIKDGYIKTTELGMNYLNTILIDFL